MVDIAPIFERLLLSLPTRYAGLYINMFCEESSSHEYENSKMISSDMTKAIIDQDYIHIKDQELLKKNKNKIKTSREKRCADKLKMIREELDDISMRLNDIAQEKAASNWLTVLPIIEQNFNLNKQQFWDAIRLQKDNYKPAYISLLWQPIKNGGNVIFGYSLISCQKYYI